MVLPPKASQGRIAKTKAHEIVKCRDFKFSQNFCTGQFAEKQMSRSIPREQGAGTVQE